MSRFRILRQALIEIARYGCDNPNRPLVRAMHRELIAIAEDALEKVSASHAPGRAQPARQLLLPGFEQPGDKPTAHEQWHSFR